MRLLFRSNRLAMLVGLSTLMIGMAHAGANCPNPLFTCVGVGPGGPKNPQQPPGGTFFEIKPDIKKTTKSLDVLITETPGLFKPEPADTGKILDILGEQIKWVNKNKTYFVAPNNSTGTSKGFVFKGSEVLP